MSWVAVAIGGSGLLGAGASIFGGNKQGKVAQQAARQQFAMYEDQKARMDPYAHTGIQATKQLDQMVTGPDAPLMQRFGLDQFQQSPSYQWQLEQGLNAINKGANARGNYYAPQTLQDLGKFQQGLASTDFNNAYNQYMGQNQQQFNMLNALAGSGQNAAALTGTMGGQAAGLAGNFMTGGAAAQAGGYMGAANALGGGAMGLAGYNQYLQGMNAPQYGMGGQKWMPGYGPNSDTMPYL
jgi:hypothetical protein